MKKIIYLVLLLLFINCSTQYSKKTSRKISNQSYKQLLDCGLSLASYEYYSKYLLSFNPGKLNDLFIFVLNDEDIVALNENEIKMAKVFDAEHYMFNHNNKKIYFTAMTVKEQDRILGFSSTYKSDLTKEKSLEENYIAIDKEVPLNDVYELFNLEIKNTVEGYRSKVLAFKLDLQLYHSQFYLRSQEERNARWPKGEPQMPTTQELYSVLEKCQFEPFLDSVSFVKESLSK